MTIKDEILQNILDKAIDNKKIFGTSFCLKDKGGVWSGASGNLHVDTPFFIASTTKLFVTSIILNFLSKSFLSLDDTIDNYLDQETLHGIHILNGKDFSNQITIKNLLAHTSGIPDYFQQKDVDGNSLEKELTQGLDKYWTFKEAVNLSKALKPLFPPGKKGKAYYSDTNFQLLGEIIENISNKSIADNFENIIFNPLNLTETYLFQDITDRKPKTLYFKDKELYIPKAMTSFGPDGGIVSTSKELVMFLDGFFNGMFFQKEYINKLKVWNRIFFPLQSGIGIHRFKLLRILDPFRTIPELWGHSGLSGALAYYSPEKDLYIAGTVNQVAFPDTSFNIAIKLIQKRLTK